MRRLTFKKTMNTRDLGGYPVGEGAYTNYSMFLRSDLPYELLEEEKQKLYDLGIRTVIDLRSDEEVLRKPCALEDKEGFTYCQFSLFGADLPKTEENVRYSYYNLTQNYDVVRSVMRTIAEAPGGVLYHCTAGKDRTGVISMLLLDLVGVSREDIVADYQVSYTYLKSFVDQLHRDNPDLPAFAGQSKAEYMHGFMELFYEKYTSAYQYLLEIGLKEEEILALRHKLVGVNSLCVGE